MLRFSEIFNRRAIRSVLRGMLRYIFGRTGQRRVVGWRMFYRLRTEVLLHSKYPIAGVSHFPASRLWVDREVFPRIQKLLLRAQHTVVIQMFIWKDDRLGRQMAAVLLEVADRGVHVEIFKEASGDFFELHRDFLSTKQSKNEIWQRFWHHPNIRVTYEGTRDHAKVYIIDDKILLLTGMNIAAEYSETLHDYMVELRGSTFVEQYLTHGELRGQQHHETRLVMNTENQKDVRPVVMHLIESAVHSIVLEQCYISDPKVLEALIQKTHQGVRVTLVVPAKTNFQHQFANMQSVARLISEGEQQCTQVFLYPTMFHGKTIFVDRTKAFIGSANLIAASLDDMGEVNVLLEGKSTLALLKLRDTLRDSILASRPLNTPPRFHWIGRWLAWMKL